MATRTYRRTDLDWLAHVDVDEFILSPAPMAGILSQADAGCAALRMPPVERLAGDEDSLFKTTARMAGRDSAVLEDIYPTFGPYLRGGYLGHLEGKLIARTGLADVRLGVHALLRDQQPVTNVATHEGLFVGHAHAPDWDTFRANLDFRLAHGAYRKNDADPGAFRRHDMLRYLRDEEGEDGLRRFFHEVCEATPRLVSQLHAHDMLVRRRLDLDAAVARVFGARPMNETRSLPKWGLVATIRAPAKAVLDFAAHHLDLGAHRLFIYLDDDNRAAHDALKAHPKCRPTLTDDAYWRRLGIKRRAKHQARQFENARHAYARAGDVDWLTHIDVDEFLWPRTDLAAQLAALPGDCLCARIRPVEALAPDHGENGDDRGITRFKACAPDRATRHRQTAAIYGDFGAVLNGGFLSHVAGKMVYRTGIADLRVQIHNVFVGEQMNPGECPLPDTELLHLHAPSWDRFRRALDYRLEKGSYRAELRPNAPREEGGVNMHELINALINDGGEPMLHRFFNEVCTATPELRARLAAHGLLRSHVLDLAAKRAHHFPDFV